MAWTMYKKNQLPVCPAKPQNALNLVFQSITTYCRLYWASGYTQQALCINIHALLLTPVLQASSFTSCSHMHSLSAAEVVFYADHFQAFPRRLLLGRRTGYRTFTGNRTQIGTMLFIIQALQGDSSCKRGTSGPGFVSVRAHWPPLET